MIQPIPRNKYLDLEEAQRLRTVAEAWAVLDLQAGRRQGPLAWMLVDTAMLTGLRVSELARLTVDDLDAKRGFLRVWRHKRRPPIQEPLAIPPELAQHLLAYINDRGLTGSIFVGKRGPLKVIGLEQLWKSAIRRAGLPKEISIHCARHTMGVHLLEKTGNLRQVQKQLGHTDPATTAMYADVTHKRMTEGVTDLYR